MQILALIPARGGSKSIPRKNIKPLAGVPSGGLLHCCRHAIQAGDTHHRIHR